MRKKQLLKKIYVSIICLIAMVCGSTNGFAQGVNWKFGGNNNVSPSSFIGPLNYEDFNFITNGLTRMTITKDGDINLLGNGNLTVKTLTADSISVRVAKIGAHSLVLGTLTTEPGNNTIVTAPFSGDMVIQSNVGLGNNQNTVLNSGNTGKVGVGYSTFLSPTTAKLAVNGNVGVNLQVPVSTFGVNGNAAIGASYSGTAPAPASGLIVEGFTGIGTATPVAALEQIVSQCCAAQSGMKQKNTNPGINGTGTNTASELNAVTKIDVELSSAKNIILDQNSPNPFADETTITYIIPQETGRAQIIFYDNSGVIVKAVDVSGRGPGSLHVFGSNLSDGVYTYSLVADGKVIDSKRMVKSK